MQNGRHRAGGADPGRRIAAALRVVVLISSTLLALTTPLHSQDANTEAEPRTLIDMPTAGMLLAGMKAFRADFYHSDGVNAAFAYGVADRLLVGLSYGGARIIGTQPPDWNEIPGVLVRLRVVEESEGFPALAIGFESQGADGYIDPLNRFTVKSPGLYLVLSKSYDASGYLGFHGGVNYSLERDDGDKDINLYGGVDKSLGSFLSLVGEYNFAWNDNSGSAIGRGRGFLNGGVFIYPGAGIVLSFHFKDLLGNHPHEGFADRTLRIELAR